MLGVLQAAAQRARHACRQSVVRNHRCCRCGFVRPRPSPSTTSSGGAPSALATSTSSSMLSSTGAAAGDECYCCVSLCTWLSSLLLFDWLPIGDVSAGVSNNGVGGSRTADGISGRSRRRDTTGTGGELGVVESGEGSGEAGRATFRRGVSRDDVKPLLSESAAFEVREKEKRFMKGQFVMPGSDMQRKIAEAMAGMLAAGNRVMTRTDSSSVSGSDNLSRQESGGSVIGAGVRYTEVADCDPHARDSGSEEDSHTRSTESNMGESSSTSRRSGASVLSHRGSPRTGTNKSAAPERFYVDGIRAVGDRGTAKEEDRECVICMEDFTKEDPEMLTLCSCGVNKTFFHYSCLLQWLAKHSYCPACRGYLFFEERPAASGDRSGDRSTNTPINSSVSGGRGRSGSIPSEDYGEAVQRALRAGFTGVPREGGVGGRDENASSEI